MTIIKKGYLSFTYHKYRVICQIKDFNCTKLTFYVLIFYRPSPRIKLCVIPKKKEKNLKSNLHYKLYYYLRFHTVYFRASVFT